VRNFIRYLIEENPERIEVSTEMIENLCSVSEEDLKRLVDETLEFIVAKNTNEVQKDAVIKRVKEMCIDQGH
jgi:hypothetical protein